MKEYQRANNKIAVKEHKKHNINSIWQSLISNKLSKYYKNKIKRKKKTQKNP
jgi:hypothetical protein